MPIELEEDRGVDVDLTPLEVNFFIRRGDDFRFYIKFTENGEIFNVLDYGFKAQIRRNFDAAEVITMDWSSALIQDGGVFVGASGIFLSLSSATTAAMAGTYEWDLQVTDPQGEESTLLAGIFRVEKDVTRV